MEDSPSKLWRLALVVTLVLLAAVLYVKIEPFRQIVDGKTPWIKDQLAEHGIRLEGSEIIRTVPVALTTGTETPTQGTGSPSAQNTSSVAQGNPAKPSTSAPKKNIPVDINQLAANQALWPKAVKIKQITSFPAVMDGKKVGEINVPAGTEVKLIQVQPDKVAVAYSPDGKPANLGGTWIKATDTDLIERVQAGR